MVEKKKQGKRKDEASNNSTSAPSKVPLPGTTRKKKEIKDEASNISASSRSNVLLRNHV